MPFRIPKAIFSVFKQLLQIHKFCLLEWIICKQSCWSELCWTPSRHSVTCICMWRIHPTNNPPLVVTCGKLISIFITAQSDSKQWNLLTFELRNKQDWRRIGPGTGTPAGVLLHFASCFFSLQMYWVDTMGLSLPMGRPRLGKHTPWRYSAAK